MLSVEGTFLWMLALGIWINRQEFADMAVRAPRRVVESDLLWENYPYFDLSSAIEKR
jgi:hypothetical protein